MASKFDESIQRALISLKKGQFIHASQAAAYWGVPESTLRHRNLGRQSRHDIDLKSRRITKQQEQGHVQWIKDMQCQTMPPTNPRNYNSPKGTE